MLFREIRNEYLKIIRLNIEGLKFLFFFLFFFYPWSNTLWNGFYLARGYFYYFFSKPRNLNVNTLKTHLIGFILKLNFLIHWNEVLECCK